MTLRGAGPREEAAFQRSSVESHVAEVAPPASVSVIFTWKVPEALERPASPASV